VDANLVFEISITSGTLDALFSANDFTAHASVAKSVCSVSLTQVWSCGQAMSRWRHTDVKDSTSDIPVPESQACFRAKAEL
jgi:hypothetical protein